MKQGSGLTKRALSFGGKVRRSKTPTPGFIIFTPWHRAQRLRNEVVPFLYRASVVEVAAGSAVASGASIAAKARVITAMTSPRMAADVLAGCGLAIAFMKALVGVYT